MLTTAFLGDAVPRSVIGVRDTRFVDRLAIAYHSTVFALSQARGESRLHDRCCAPPANPYESKPELTLALGPTRHTPCFDQEKADFAATTVMHLEKGFTNEYGNALILCAQTGPTGLRQVLPSLAHG